MSKEKKPEVIRVRQATHEDYLRIQGEDPDEWEDQDGITTIRFATKFRGSGDYRQSECLIMPEGTYRKVIIWVGNDESRGEAVEFNTAKLRELVMWPDKSKHLG
jgi:hypothetical protein